MSGSVVIEANDSLYTINIFIFIVWLTDSIKQFTARCILEENIFDVSLRSLAEELQDVGVGEDFLDTNFLLYRRDSVWMFLEVDHLHCYRFARHSIDKELNSARIQEDSINLKWTMISVVSQHLLSVSSFT